MVCVSLSLSNCGEMWCILKRTHEDAKTFDFERGGGAILRRRRFGFHQHKFYDESVVLMMIYFSMDENRIKTL